MIEFRRYARDTRWQMVALVVLAMLAYVNALPNGFIWDDDQYVVNNMALRSLEGLRLIWFKMNATPQYYPLVHSGFWIEYHLWGLNPLGYHLTNVLLHGIGAACLFLCLRHLRVPGAWVTAAIVAVHPVAVESVAWITERKNVLSAVFYFLALLAFMKSVRWDAESRQPISKGGYALAIGLFICALLSKTVVCSLPAVIVLLIWWRCDTWTARERRDALLTLPLFIIGFVMALNTVILERNHVGAKGMEWDFSFVERCLIAGRSICFYVGKVLWPDPLIFFYERWTIDAAAWWQYLFPVAVVLTLAVTVAMHKRWGKGLPVGLMIFCGTLLPALGFFNVYPHRYSFVADHFQYLAMPAVIALIVAGIVTALKRIQSNATRPAIAATVAVLAICIVISNTRSAVYADQETLWLDTIKQNPTCWAAYNNLGNEYMDDGRLNEAEGCFIQTLRLKPNHVKAAHNLGKIYTSPTISQPAQAERFFRHAADMGLRHPPMLDWLVNYYTMEGVRATNAGQKDLAKKLFLSAITILRMYPDQATVQGRIQELQRLTSTL